METRVYKAKGTEVLKLVEITTTGKPVRVLAIIGQVKELLKRNIIFEDNTAGNLEKWALITDPDEGALSFETRDEAINHAKQTIYSVSN